MPSGSRSVKRRAPLAPPSTATFWLGNVSTFSLSDLLADQPGHQCPQRRWSRGISMGACDSFYRLDNHSVWVNRRVFRRIIFSMP